MTSERFPVVILSAGMSTRMGFPKLLLAQDDEPLIIKMVERLCCWGDVTILLSDDLLVKFINGTLPQVSIVINQFPERGMISSIRLGLDKVSKEADGILVWQVDHPLVSETTLCLIQEEAVTENVVVPTYNGRRGHPTWWGRAYFDALRSSSSDNGARDVLRLDDTIVKEVPVQDEGILHNIDRPEDARRFCLTRFDL
jgi:molybdenum cofactor cytidylyltransferase